MIKKLNKLNDSVVEQLPIQAPLGYIADEKKGEVGKDSEYQSGPSGKKSLKGAKKLNASKSKKGAPSTAGKTSSTPTKASPWSMPKGGGTTAGSVDAGSAPASGKAPGGKQAGGKGGRKNGSFGERSMR